MTKETVTTIVIAGVIAILFIAVIVSEIIKKKKGKTSCSCGGSCGACGLCHGCDGNTESKSRSDSQVV